MEDNTSSSIETPNVQSINTNSTGGIRRWQVNTIIILGLLLLITLGLIFYVIAFKKPSTSTVTLNNVTPKMNTVVNPYKGWLSYQNSTFGYSLKYPSNWSINTTQANAPQQPAPVFVANESKILLESSGSNINTLTFIYNENIDFSSQTGGYLAKTQPITISGKTYYLAYINTSANCTVTPQTPINQLPSSCGNGFTQIFISNTLPTISSIESAPYPQYAYATATLNGKTSVIMDSLSSEQSISTISSNTNISSFINIVKSIQI